jgi:hypothetical protein
MAGLRALKRPDEVAKRRGLPEDEVAPMGVLRAYRESRHAPHTPVEVP